MFELLLCLIFSLFCVMAYYTIIIQNPINSLLSLICCFFLLTFLCLIFEFTFFAMVIVTIYIGAVAIFFLFVLMFINIPFILKKITKLDKYFFILFFFFIFYFWLNIIPVNFFFFFDSTFLDNQQIPDIIELEFLDYTDTLNILSFFLYGYCSIFVIFLGFLLYMTLVSTLFIILQDETQTQNI